MNSKPEKSTLKTSLVLTCSLRINEPSEEPIDVYISAENWRRLKEAMRRIDPTHVLNRKLCKWSSIKPAS